MGRLPKLGFSTLDRRPPVRHHPLMSSSKLVKVLSIDGGGIRGYLPAVFLAEVERRAARPISGLFDLVVGTSTGGIIGLGLAAGKNAAELAEFYPMYGRRIFGGVDNRSEWDKRLWGSGGNIMQSVNLAAKRIGGPFGGNALFGGNARHTAEGLESALKEVFGEMKLSEVPTELAITTFDRLTSSPCVLSSRDARLDSSYDLLVREVARATSAAPTYFPPAKLAWAGQAREFIDGGVWANNPAGVAVNESIAITARRGLQGSAVLLVSLGTGVIPGESVLEGTQSWLGSARDLIGLATSVGAGELLAQRAVGNAQYRRFQVVDSRVAGAMNDPSVERLKVLREAADALVARESADIDALIADLSD